MHSPKFIFIGALLALSSTTTAIPRSPEVNKTDDSPTTRECFVPALGVHSLQDPFTLSVITDEDPKPWTVIFSDSRTQNGYQLSITRYIIAEPEFEPLFQFENGKLTAGPESDGLTAFFGPSPPVRPPLLDGLYFDDVTPGGKFYGAYNCDAKGSKYLELRTSERNCHHSTVFFN